MNVSVCRLVSGVQTSGYDAKNLSVASNDKPPPKPKRPLNMFLRFSREIRPKIIEKNPNAKMTGTTLYLRYFYYVLIAFLTLTRICLRIEVGRMVGEMWRKTDDNERERLKKAFEEDLKYYNTQMITYNEYCARNPEIQCGKTNRNRAKRVREIKNVSIKFDHRLK